MSAEKVSLRRHNELLSWRFASAILIAAKKGSLRRIKESSCVLGALKLTAELIQKDLEEWLFISQSDEKD